MMMQTYHLTNKQARRFVLAWQGLWGPQRFAQKQGALAFVRQVGCVQYDPVDICGKNAELVLFSRVKGFQKPMLSQLLYKERALVDHWDKNMAICPVENWPSLSRNRRRFRGWSYTDESRRAVSEALPAVRAAVAQKGVVTSQDIGLDEKIDWPWAPMRLSRAALEYLYFTGETCIHHRSGAQRYYAPAPAHLPEALLHAPDPHPNDEDYFAWHTQRRIAAVGLLWNRPSAAFLAIGGYHAAARAAAFDMLLAKGHIFACQVEGLSHPLYAVAAGVPLLEEILREEKSVSSRLELIAPLDSFLWDRKLVQALFSFTYKWEIYTPAEKMQYAHYALPVLYQNGFAGRIEVVADRAAGSLVARRFWPENGFCPSKAFWGRLQRHLGKLARFNGCEQVQILFDM